MEGFKVIRWELALIGVDYPVELAERSLDLNQDSLARLQWDSL